MSSNIDERFDEMKQFLASAITDISTYIQLADTKVSIIMGALVALIAGILARYDQDNIEMMPTLKVEMMGCFPSI